MSIKKIIKIVGMVIAVVLIVFGCIEGLCGMFCGENIAPKMLDSAVSLSGANRVSIDGEGNIYIANSGNATMQVFDNSGKFLYGYKLPTAGGDLWIKFSDGKLYAYAVRKSEVYVISNGVIEDNYSADYSNLELFYDNTVSYGGVNIKLSVLRKTLSIRDENGSFIRKVSIDAPLFPLSGQAGIILFAIGVIIMFCLYMDKFEKFAVERKI